VSESRREIYQTRPRAAGTTRAAGTIRAARATRTARAARGRQGGSQPKPRQSAEATACARKPAETTVERRDPCARAVAAALRRCLEEAGRGDQAPQACDGAVSAASARARFLAP